MANYNINWSVNIIAIYIEIPMYTVLQSAVIIVQKYNVYMYTNISRLK